MIRLFSKLNERIKILLYSIRALETSHFFLSLLHFYIHMLLLTPFARPVLSAAVSDELSVKEMLGLGKSVLRFFASWETCFHAVVMHVLVMKRLGSQSDGPGWSSEWQSYQSSCGVGPFSRAFRALLECTSPGTRQGRGSHHPRGS